MPNLGVKDNTAASTLVKTSGDGSASNPHIPHNVLSTGACGILGVSGSPLVVQGESTSLSAIQSTPTGTGNAWPVRLTDTTDGVAVTSGSQLEVNMTSGSVVVTNIVSASIASGSVALLAGANVVGSASAIQSTPTGLANAWPVRLTDTTDGVAVTSSSQLEVNMSSGSVVVTNTVSASISSGSVALLAGANVVGSASAIQSSPTGVANAWPVRLTDTTDGVAVTSSSQLEVNLSSGSVVVTNVVSASISSGSVALLAGTNVVGSASVIQSTAAADTAPWPVKISDGTDVAVVDSASRLTVAASAVVTNTVSASLGTGTAVIGSASVIQSTAAANSGGWPVKVTDGTNIYGVPGSPLVVAPDNGRVWVSTSLLDITSVDLSASGAGSQVAIAGTGGKKIRILSLLFTVSTSMNISWRSGSTGGVDLRSPMYFATHGGMDPRWTHGYFAEWASGCAAVLSQNVAGSVRGVINYVAVPD